MKPYHLCPLLLVAVLSATSYTRAEIRTAAEEIAELGIVATWNIHRKGLMADGSHRMVPLALHPTSF